MLRAASARDAHLLKGHRGVHDLGQRELVEQLEVAHGEARPLSGGGRAGENKKQNTE